MAKVTSFLTVVWLVMVVTGAADAHSVSFDASLVVDSRIR